MQPIRRARLQSTIQDELSVLISRELKDPRVPSVTITQVEVTPDAEQATIYIMILGAGVTDAPDADVDKMEAERREQMKACLKGLSSASGFMRRHLAKALTVRNVPELIFREDKGLDNVIRVNTLLKQIADGGSKPEST